MSIDVTKEGRFRVRVTSEPKKRHTIGVFDLEIEALRAEAAAKDVLRGKRKTTLGAVIEDCLDYRELNKVVRNPDDDVSRYRTHLKEDPIMALPIADVRRRDIVELIDRLKPRVNAHQTLLNILTVLRNGLNFALEKELITATPYVNIRLPAPASTEESWSYASPREQRHLLETTPYKYRPMIGFAIGTGLRAGELVTLRLRDVHIDVPEPFVTVRYGSPPDGPPKNGKIRRVPLLPLAFEAVVAQLALLKEPLGSAKKPRPRMNLQGLLFPTEREGSFRDPDHVMPWATWAKVRSPLGNQLRWHDLRHTCASSLVSGWWGRRWSLEETCAMLGHSDIRVTQRYAHLAESALMKAASETPGGRMANSRGHHVAIGLPGGHTQVSGITRSRLGDLNPRPAVYETAPLPAKSTTSESGGHPEGNAKALLEAVAADDEDDAARHLEALATEVMSRPEVALALQVLRGGPFALRAGIELATRLLAAEAPAGIRAGGAR